MSFYNEQNDILVKINGEQFVILGDESQVTDAEIMAMYEGKAPIGWTRSQW